MKERPFIVVFLNLIVSIFVFGYTIRIFDEKLSQVSGQNFESLTNSLWLSVVTMTTVGYGDFYPKSLPSRLIGVVLSFWGVYLVSLFLIALDNALEWEDTEEKAYDMITSLQNKEEIKRQSVYTLTSMFKLKKTQNKERKGIKYWWWFNKYIGYKLSFKKAIEEARGRNRETKEDLARKELKGISNEVLKAKLLVSKALKHVKRTKNL